MYFPTANILTQKITKSRRMDKGHDKGKIGQMGEENTHELPRAKSHNQTQPDWRLNRTWPLVVSVGAD